MYPLQLEHGFKRLGLLGWTLALSLLAGPASANPILAGDVAETDFSGPSSIEWQPLDRPNLELGERRIGQILYPVSTAHLRSTALKSLRLYDLDGRALRQLKLRGRVALLHVKR